MHTFLICNKTMIPTTFLLPTSLIIFKSDLNITPKMFDKKETIVSLSTDLSDNFDAITGGDNRNHVVNVGVGTSYRIGRRLMIHFYAIFFRVH